MYTSIRADVFDYNEIVCWVYAKKERAELLWFVYGSNTAAAAYQHNHIHMDTRSRASKQIALYTQGKSTCVCIAYYIAYVWLSCMYWFALHAHVLSRIQWTTPLMRIHSTLDERDSPSPISTNSSFQTMRVRMRGYLFHVWRTHTHTHTTCTAPVLNWLQTPIQNFCMQRITSNDLFVIGEDKLRRTNKK